MNWTFGIITDGKSDHLLCRCLDSIDSLNINKDNHEILVVGKTNLDKSKFTWIDFDDDQKKGWVTRKKNILAENAKFDHISLCHDYVAYDTDWYNQFKDFGSDWDVCMCRILNMDGLRFRDWTKWEPEFIDYSDISQTDKMYISGTYFCVKKSFLLENPFDEELVWGKGEDVEWSLRLRDSWKYRCNPKSIVHFLRLKDHNPISNPSL